MLKIHSRNYLEIDLIEIKQKDKLFYVGKIPARELLSIYTVRPAKYDVEKNISLASSFPNDKDYYSHLISEDKSDISEKDFQRKYSEGRVNEIKKFLNEEEYAFFPNTIISNCDLINDLDSFEIDEKDGFEAFKNLADVPSHLSYFFKDGNTPKILIPFTENALLIIDGQHRLEGLKKSDEDVQNNYELLVAFIIGFDRSVIAQQFYTINYEQKPVNKSLLYHLMGEFSSNLDELTFTHKVVKALNELEQSPFHKRIKMLGTTPPDYDREERQKLSISLAFFIDSLSRTLTGKVSPGLYQPIFRYYFENERYQIEIIRTLINYFSAVETLVPAWNYPSRNLISKGMGVGALIKVFQLIFPIFFVEEFDEDPGKIQSMNNQFFLDKMKGIETMDFSTEGEFGRSGSSGSMNKIKERIIEHLKYLGEPTYSKFELDYRKENGPLDRYKNWLKTNLD